MNTIRELSLKGKQLKQRIEKFGAPLGNQNAAGPHDGYGKGQDAPGLHRYAPRELSVFLSKAQNLGFVSIGKARSSHTAHLVVPFDRVDEVKRIASENGLASEIGRTYHRANSKAVQLVIKAPN